MITTLLKYNLCINEHLSYLALKCPKDLVRLITETESLDFKPKEIFFEIDINTYTYKNHAVLTNYVIYPRYLDPKSDTWVAGAWFKFSIYYDFIIKKFKPLLVHRTINKLNKLTLFSNSLAVAVEGSGAYNRYLNLFDSKTSYNNVVVVTPLQNKTYDVTKYRYIDYILTDFRKFVFTFIEMHYDPYL